MELKNTLLTNTQFPKFLTFAENVTQELNEIIKQSLKDQASAQDIETLKQDMLSSPELYISHELIMDIHQSKILS